MGYLEASFDWNSVREKVGHKPELVNQGVIGSV